MFIFQMRKQSPRNNWSQASQLLSHRAGTRTQVLDSLNLSLLNVSVVGFGGLCIFDFTSEQHATTVNLNQVVNRAYNLRKLDINLPIPVVEQPVWVNCEFLLVLAGFFPIFSFSADSLPPLGSGQRCSSLVLVQFQLPHLPPLLKEAQFSLMLAHPQRHTNLDLSIVHWLP